MQKIVPDPGLGPKCPDSEPNKTLWLLLRCRVLLPTLPQCEALTPLPLGRFGLCIFQPILVRTRYNPAISNVPSSSTQYPMWEDPHEPGHTEPRLSSPPQSPAGLSMLTRALPAPDLCIFLYLTGSTMNSQITQHHALPEHTVSSNICSLDVRTQPHS